MLFSFFQSHHGKLGFIALSLYLLLNNTINAITLVMDAQREAVEAHAQWEYFVWEYSSAIAFIVLIPVLVQFLAHYPINWKALTKTALLYFGMSVFFSIAHIGLMVLLRKSVYLILGRGYDFNFSLFEFIYEYHKDAWSFVFFILLIKGYQTLTSQMLGEANPINVEGEPLTSVNGKQLKHLLVRKLGKEFIVNVEDIEWLQAAGNYVNLHINSRLYPIRSTLSTLCEQLEETGIVRIHRSYAVNLGQIDSITPLPSGDSEIKLQNGERLNLSRRYKAQFKAFLH
ncbi:LytTR family DNA-binding domain-containing protein [Pseudoalteromonas sp. T1lg65]|uniref:LytTR family DNA-binding domain-containing protein n=1 Tax=Pseudoalteromonas sp. T1lg65 TaxID=2077101 RepID=UPI003F7A7BBB